MSVFKIAPNHNNIAGLLTLPELNPPLFDLYTAGIVASEWHPYESRERDGDRNWRIIGRPWTKLLLPIVTPEEYQEFVLLADTGQQQGLVTIQEWNKTANLWQIFNATLELPDDRERRWRYGHKEFQDVEIFLYDLEVIA